MNLTELIIKAHAHAHAAELAIKANRPDCAYNELNSLDDMLTDELPNVPSAEHKHPNAKGT